MHILQEISSDNETVSLFITKDDSELNSKVCSDANTFNDGDISSILDTLNDPCFLDENEDEITSENTDALIDFLGADEGEGYLHHIQISDTEIVEKNLYIESREVNSYPRTGPVHIFFFYDADTDSNYTQRYASSEKELNNFFVGNLYKDKDAEIFFDESEIHAENIHTNIKKFNKQELYDEDTNDWMMRILYYVIIDGDKYQKFDY